MHQWRQILLLRICIGVILALSGAVTIMLFTHRSSHPVLGPFSLPAALTFLIAVSVAIASAVLCFLPHEKLILLAGWLQDGSKPFLWDPPCGRPRTGLLLTTIGLVSYFLVALPLQSRNVAPRDDQLDYLRTADVVRQLGMPELLRQLMAGTYLEANRHPLYPALLSLTSGFSAGKRMGLLMGALVVAIAWCGVTRRHGWLLGGAAAVLFATNSLVLESATLIACEMLLLLCSLLAWFVIDAGLARTGSAGPLDGALQVPIQDGDSDTASGGGLVSDDPISRTAQKGIHSDVRLGMMSILVGALLGLAYLVKASAVFLLAGFLLWSVGVARVRRWSWLAVIGFAVVSAPLLVRNTIAYQDPLYSFNNRFLFADSFEGGLRGEFRGTWRAAGDYWSDHSLRDMASRLLHGLGWEGLIWLRSLGPAGLGDSRSLVGLVIALVAGLGAMGSDRRLVGVALFWIVPFYLFFAWYVPIAAGDRFLAPVIPIVLLFAARGTVLLITAGSPLGIIQVERRLIVLSLLWCFTCVMLAMKP